MNFIKRIYNKHSFIFLSLLIVLLFSTVSLQAQDIHFSQILASPLMVSPANTGNFDGDYRINYNQKSQWSVISPYNTFGLSYDQPYYRGKQKFSFGGTFINDRTINGRFNTSKLYVSGAWHKIHKWHYFHVGLQAGFVIHSLSDDIVYASQYVDVLGDIDGSVDAGEQVELNPGYLDVNIGLGWHKKFNKIEPHVNLSFFHINNPRVTFTDIDNHLPIRQIANVFVNMYLIDKFYVTPSLLYMTTSGATDMYFGSNFTFVLANELMEQSVFCGAYFKNEFQNFDAIVALIGARYNEWQIGVSYDINMSDLKIATNSRGGFEISIIYKALNTRINKFILPCERF